MKIRVGGGGIDAQSRWHQEEQRIVEAPDDFFERAAQILGHRRKDHMNTTKLDYIQAREERWEVLRTFLRYLNAPPTFVKPMEELVRSLQARDAEDAAEELSRAAAVGDAEEIEMFLRDGISDKERDAYKLDEAKKAWADSVAREATAADGRQTMQSIDEQITTAVEEMSSDSFRFVVNWIGRLGSLPGTPQDRLRDLLINRLMSTRRAWEDKCRAGLADAARKS